MALTKGEEWESERELGPGVSSLDNLNYIRCGAIHAQIYVIFNREALPSDRL